ncbi:hypothetical protein O181_118229 [Austropuccinia psidii MF-1]|uniref:Uncharacterized protein n=1 Tax=Austropuccinia psidii MF-1 TaxID=1389203 RepID=A0A9Q3KEV9_9BASI|nr:hypothetical protein [Austropuccinia psidii MF-1]
MPLYTCPGLLLLSRMPMLHMQNLMLVQVLTMLKVPYASHANHYACTSSRKFKKTPTVVQAPDNSHANPYACECSRHFNSFLMPVQASNDSHANPYACEGCQQC